jgi:hypothetical protein
LQSSLVCSRKNYKDGRQVTSNSQHVLLFSKGGIIRDFAKWWTRSKMTSLKVMNNITNPSYFISTFVKKKKIIAIISTLQMAQATSSPKSKVEIVLDVSHFNTPCMAIMFFVHSLHFPRVTDKTNNEGGVQTKHHH